MRSYKPKPLVVTALRKSAFLDVSADGKTIKRKVALQGQTLLDKDFAGEDNEIAYDPRTARPVVPPVHLTTQQKKVYPEHTSNNTRKHTGFEATYVEPPITPEEAEAEGRMYDEDKPFVERIEIAIQRFKQKRRMQAIYAKVFDKFMSYGGVDCTPRAHQGLSKTELKEMDAEEVARSLATHTVPWNRTDETQWTVDFLAVGAAFL